MEWHKGKLDPKFTFQRFFVEAVEAHLRRYRQWRGLGRNLKKKGSSG